MTAGPGQEDKAAATITNLSVDHPATAQIAQEPSPATPRFRFQTGSHSAPAAESEAKCEVVKETEQPAARPERFPYKQSPQPRFAAARSIPNESEEERPLAQEPESQGRFDSARDLSKTPKAQQAKINMSAVKALTPLVAAISFKPGSRSEPTLKSKALSDLICKAQTVTTDIAMVMGPNFANSDWARGQIMQVVSDIAAKQWERYGEVNMDDIGRCMSAALREPTAELSSALESFDGADQYREANNEQIAKARLSVTLCTAAWELHDWVTNEKLQLRSDTGDAVHLPSRVFSYGLHTSEIVDALLSRVVDEARGFELQILSADIRLAHLQGTIRRLSQIAGAEYVTQTIAVHQWIENSLSEQERHERQEMANKQIHTHVIPRVIEWARTNYAAVESKAQKIINGLSQEKTNEEPTRHADR